MSNGNSRSLANKNVKTLTSRVMVGGIYDKEYMTLFGYEQLAEISPALSCDFSLWAALQNGEL